MKLSRFAVKCLAVVVGFLGFSVALSCILFLCLYASGSLDSRLHRIDVGILQFFVGLTALTAVLGILILRQAWIHLRRPDRNSANLIVGIASFMLGMWLFHYASDHSLIPKPGGTWGPTVELAVGLGLTVVCFLFYRIVLRPIAARAFPGRDTPAPTLASGSTP